MSLLDQIAAGIDRVVGAVSPHAELSRAGARVMRQRVNRFSSYDSAKAGSRTWANRSLTSGSADSDLDADTLDRLRERSRDRMRNDGVAAAAINALADNVVGVGMRPNLRLDHRALGISRERARALSRQAARIWLEWGQHADSCNRLTIDDIQHQVFSQVLVNGDVLVQPLMVTDARVRSRYELRLEVIEGDRLDTPDGMEARGGRPIRNGVELGARSQPVAYWVSLEHPGDTGLHGSRFGERTFRRIAAHNLAGRPNILHVYHQERPGQTRGRPYLSPVLDLFKDLDDYAEAELVAAQVSACFAAFVTKSDPYVAALSNATADTRGKADRQEELVPGMIEYLGQGESVSFGNPTRPNTSFADFVMSVKREITSALGMPYEVATRDFSGTTYSQARASLIEARRMFQRRQRWLVQHFLQPVWLMLLEEAWLKGEFDAGQDFFERVALWTQTQWIAQGWGWIDPKSEAAAEAQKLELGIQTRTKLVASMDGDEWEDIAEQLAEEEELRRELGLQQAPAPAGGGASDESEDEEGAQDEDESASEAVEEAAAS